MNDPSEQELDAAYDEANALAIEVLHTLGLVLEESGESVVGRVSVGIAGAALGLAAGRLMAAANDESFARWIISVCAERSKTGASELTEH